MRLGWISASFAAVSLLSAFPAAADFPEGAPDRVRFGVGGLYANLDTQGGVGTEQGGVGTYVNFENAFDLPGDKSTWTFAGYWQVKPRHYLDFGYVEINRSGARSIKEDVTWGDWVYKAGGVVRADWESNFPYAAYRYDFLHGAPVRIGGTAGVSYLHLGAGLTANGTATKPDGTPVSGTVSDSASVNFPVPLVGMRIDWAFAKRWNYLIYYRFFFLSVNKLRGGMGEAGMQVEWFPTRHFGLGTGIESTRIDIRQFSSGDQTGRFGYGFLGLTLYLMGTF